MSDLRINQVDLFIGEQEKALVDDCLDRRWLTEGKYAAELAENLKALTGARHVTFAPNGTLALFLAFLALDLEKGSEVIMPSFTFYATATAAVFAGLKPVFIDVDPSTFNAVSSAFEKAITPRTRALLPAHIYGQVSDIRRIRDLARSNGLFLIEDAAQACGVTFDDKHAGTFGDIGVYSLFSDKVITAGEGGVLLTDSDELYEKIKLLRNQGRPNAGTFVHPALGMNFRITDLQAAIALAQLEKLPGIIQERNAKWRLCHSELSGVGDLRFMECAAGSTLVPFRFPIITSKRDLLMQYLEDNGVQTRGFFYPMHLQPQLKEDPVLSLPVSERLWEQGICLPIHHGLTDDQITRISHLIKKFFSA